MTARKTRMMNDSYLISMFYRPQCIVGSVVLFFKAVVIAKRLTRFWVVIIDHFHKWRPITNSFANIKISLSNLILKLIFKRVFTLKRG